MAKDSHQAGGRGLIVEGMLVLKYSIAGAFEIFDRIGAHSIVVINGISEHGRSGDRELLKLQQFSPEWPRA